MSASVGTGCSDDPTDTEPIKIGLVAPQTGALEFVGESFADVFQAAVDEINAKGGVNGHPLEAVIKDSATDPATAAMMIGEMIDEGVVASVGPATSGSVEAAYPVAAAAMFPIISPSSTAPGLAEVTDDGGFMFRNVPNDNIQGVAMAYYLTAVRSPAITSVAIVQEDTLYGDGLATAFTTAFEGEGGTVVGVVKYTQNDAKPGTVMDELNALNPAPDFIMMVALEQDGLAIINEWDSTATLAGAEWFLTDGARSSGFLAGLPVSMLGTEGTAPTFPILGDAYGEVEDAFMAAKGRDIGQEVFGPNVWDATYLIAAGLLVQDRAGQEFGGAGLRDAIVDVSHGPGVVLHAGQWRDITTTINSGNDIDYDGAAGPNDFDANGEAIGPYEVWRVVDDNGSLAFEQVLFLEAGEIEGLLAAN